MDHIDRTEFFRDIFNLVANADDWKAPINVVLPYSVISEWGGMANFADAIEFFTATEATFRQAGWDENDKVLVRIQAAGYRMGPAA